MKYYLVTNETFVNEVGFLYWFKNSFVENDNEINKRSWSKHYERDSRVPKEKKLCVGDPVKLLSAGGQATKIYIHSPGGKF